MKMEKSLDNVAMLRYSASENCNGDLRARDGQIELTVLFAVLCNARLRGLGVRREGLFMKRRLIAFICALAISLCGLGGFAAAYAADDTGAGMKLCCRRITCTILWAAHSRKNFRARSLNS